MQAAPGYAEGWLAGRFGDDAEGWLAGRFGDDAEGWLAGRFGDDTEGWLAGWFRDDAEGWLAGWFGDDDSKGCFCVVDCSVGCGCSLVVTTQISIHTVYHKDKKYKVDPPPSFPPSLSSFFSLLS